MVDQKDHFHIKLNQPTGVVVVPSDPPSSLYYIKFNLILIFYILDGRYWSKRSCPKWWDPTIEFRNLKFGYSKDMLIKLILAYRASHSITSPIRDRSPYSSPAYTPLLSPPSGFSDVSNSPQRITPDSTHASVSDSILFQTADSDSYNLGQEVEIYADSLDGSASKCSSEQPEHYFPARKSIFQPQTIISVNRDDEYATALSELSDKDTLLTDTTIHAFMVC